MTEQPRAAQDFVREVAQRDYGTILADPPWQFTNRTGKMAPEHKRLSRYPTLTLADIKEIPVPTVTAAQSHLYLWVPNALLREGLDVMEAWGFEYKTNLVWHKIRKDGGPDGRGVENTIKTRMTRRITHPGNFGGPSDSAARFPAPCPRPWPAPD